MWVFFFTSSTRREKNELKQHTLQLHVEQLYGHQEGQCGLEQRNHILAKVPDGLGDHQGNIPQQVRQNSFYDDLKGDMQASENTHEDEEEERRGERDEKEA